MELRHEWKHEISFMDLLVIRQRLSAVAKRDVHAVNGKYFIRSLYFDTPEDKALREKLNGISRREKFRIRYYNLDHRFYASDDFLSLKTSAKSNAITSA